MSTVTQLRPTLPVDDRACAAMRLVLDGIETLNDITLEAPDALTIFLRELERAGSSLSLLHLRLRMRKSTVNLCDRFGRAL